MNSLNITDIDRNFSGIPDDPKFTKTVVKLVLAAFLIGMAFAIGLTVAYYKTFDPNCSAYPICTEHKGK